MESDDFGFLAPAYVRGFLRTYAGFLAVNEQPLLEEFDNLHAPSATQASAIAMLEARARSRPRARRRTSSWTVAAMLASIALVAITIIGVINPAGDRAGSRLGNPARNGDTAQRPQPASRAGAEPAPAPSRKRQPGPGGGALAETDAIRLKIKAVNGECWIDVTADGINVASEMLPLGAQKTFTASRDMDILLGLPNSVVLVVNGRNIGSPRGSSPVTISLPQDIDSLASL
jgi:hypothetical protein